MARLLSAVGIGSWICSAFRFPAPGRVALHRVRRWLIFTKLANLAYEYSYSVLVRIIRRHRILLSFSTTVPAERDVLSLGYKDHGCSHIVQGVLGLANNRTQL